MMHFIVISVVMAGLLVVGPRTAWAAQSTDMEICFNEQYKQTEYIFQLDTARNIKSCTEVIKQGSKGSVELIARAYLKRGDAYKLRKRYDQISQNLAISDYNKAIGLKPDFADAFFARGNAYAEAGQSHLAKDDYTKAINSKPTAEFYVRRGDINLQLGKDDLAITDYSEAIRRGASVRTFELRGAALLKKGENDRAIADFDAVLQAYPLDGKATRLRNQALAAKAAIQVSQLAIPPDVDTQASPPEGLFISTVTANPIAATRPSKHIEAGAKVALVIGNGAYQGVGRLQNPQRDAMAVADTLRAIGFSVELVTDVDRIALIGALRDFSVKADGAEIALVYYSGHAVQIARSAAAENYLLPVDAKLADIRDADEEAITLSKVLERASGARARIVVLDACRDNPFAARIASSTRAIAARGLTRSSFGARGSLVIFATQPDNVAQDGVGELSPFTAAFVAHARTPNLDVRLMAARVREQVDIATGGRQTPFSDDGLIGEVFLARQ